MLFLGTKKYPIENSFKKFLDEHGGDNNAYTDTEEVVYYFNVNAPYLKDGLEIWSNFFTDPLLSEECLNREINVFNYIFYIDCKF